MADIRDLTSLATSTPDEAANNIADASIMDVTPGAYKEYKPEMQPKVDQLRKPAEASDTTKEYMQQGTEHASLAASSTEHLSYMDRVINTMGEILIDKPSREERLSDLTWKKMWDKGFSEDDQIEIDNINFNKQELERRNYGIEGKIEQPNPEMFSNFSDMADGALNLLGQVPDAVVGTYRTLYKGAGEAAQEPDLKSISKVPIIGPGIASVMGAEKAMFKQVVAGAYNSMSNLNDDKGNPVEVDETTKKSIAIGVGVVTQALEHVGLGALLEPAAPFFAKFIKPASLMQELINSPRQLALKKSVMALGEAMAHEGTTESLQEVASIVGEEIALGTKDKSIVNSWQSESQLIDSLTRVTPKVVDYFKRTAVSGAVGGLAGGATAGPAAALGFSAMNSEIQEASDFEVNKKLKQFNPDRPLNLVEESSVNQSMKVLQIKEAMDNVVKVGKSSEMYKLAPGEVSNFNRMAFAKAGIEKVWINLDQIAKEATSPENVEEAKRLMGVPESIINAPTPVSVHKFLEYATDNPDVMEHMQLTPDGPSVSQADQFITKMRDMDTKRKTLMRNLGIKESELVTSDDNVIKANFEKPLVDPQSLINRAQIVMNDMQRPDLSEGDRLVMQNQLDEIKAEVKRNFTVSDKPGDLLIADWSTPVEEKAIQVEGEFLKSETYTKAIRSVVPEAEQTKFDKAVLDARTEYLEGVRQAAQLELNKMLDLNFELAMEEQRQIEMERILNSPEFKLVDKFMAERIKEDGKLISMYAMDPAKFTDEQLMKYGKDKRLHKIGALKKGKMDAEQAARAIGAANGNELLRVLSVYPTSQEIKEARSAAHAAEIHQQVLDQTPISHAKILRALTNESKIATQVMEHLKSKEWASAKGAIKRIALPMPRIPEIQHQVYMDVQTTALRDLNVRQFRVGQKRSQREAVTAILKSEPAIAFKAKEQEIINIEMQKAAHTAIGKANRVIKFAKRFKEADTIKILKEAGPTYLNAINEIFDLYNFDPKAKGTAEVGSFAKWAQEQYEKGAGDFSIPEYAQDLRESVNDMTVEQILAIGDRLRAILHTAKDVNKIYGAMKAQETQWEMENLQDRIHNDLSVRPDYNSDRIPPTQDHDVTNRYRARKAWNSMGSLFTNFEFVVKQMDLDQNAGFYQELFIQKLKGDGAYYEQMGNSLRFKYQKTLKEFFEKHIKEYGEKDYHQLGFKLLDIPEFRNSSAFNNGKLSKSSLITLWMYGGDPDGRRKRSANSGVDEETIQRVLDRELEERDVVLAQKMVVDGFNTYRSATEALQKKTGGQEVTFIEGVPNTHRGKTYAGGYVPNKHKIDYEVGMMESAMTFLRGKTNPFQSTYDARQYAAETTEQGRLEERTGSNKPLDLSFTRMLRAHEEVIHDLSYREPTLDILKILKDEKIRADLIATVGKAKYDLMVSSVLEIANRMDAENKNYFADQNRFIWDAIRRMQSNFSVAVLGFNPTSVLIQSSSIAQALQNMGLTGGEHMATVVNRLRKNPDLVAGFYKFAVELDPTIGHFLEGINNKIVSNIMELAPGSKFDGALGVAQQAHKLAVNSSMSFMGGMDMTIKTIVALSAYEQFMAGEAENYSLDRLYGMSEKERHEAAQAYVGQISRTSLTHSQNEDKAPFQKNPLGSTMSNYWNDARNVLNNQVTQGRKATRYSKESFTSAKEGDYGLASKKASYAAGVMITTIMVSAATRYLDDWLHNRPVPDFDFSSRKGVENAAKYLVSSPMTLAAEMTPFVRDIKYGMGGKSSIKKANLPLTSMMSDMATTANAVVELISQKRSMATLTKGQYQAILRSASVLFIPFPVGGPTKLWRQVTKKSSQPKEGEVDKARVAIQEYKADPPAGESDKFMKDLDTFNKSITPDYREQ